MNLENCKCGAKPTVQTCRRITSDGCKVTLVFEPTSDPDVRRDVAQMLLAAFQSKAKESKEQ